MASVDGRRTLQGASDELYDIICGPCKTDKVEKQANHYCKECREYLCNPCKDYHRKLAVTKNHNILSGNKIPAPSSISQGSDFVAYCGCNKKQDVEFYCEDHRDVICSQCQIVMHRKCKFTNVQEKRAGYTTSTFNSILTKTNALIDKFDSMQKERKTDSKELKRLKEKCRKEIKAFRAKTDAFIDKLEQNIMRELDKHEDEQQKHIDQQMSALTTALQMLDSDNHLLEDAKKDGNTMKMFMSDVQVSKSIPEIEAMLKEMEKDAFKPAISFEGNKRLTDIQTEISFLGTLKGTEKSLDSYAKGGNACKLNTKVVLGKKIQSQSQVNIRFPDDTSDPVIRGCAFLPRGQAVLCDFKNNKLKLLDKDLVLTECLKFSTWPCDVSVVDESNVVITLPESKQFQYIQVFPQLKARRVIQLDVECRGIEVFGDKIYTTHVDNSGRGGVFVFGLNGDKKQPVGVKKFKSPYYTTVSTSGKKIYVSDGTNSTPTVTCMTNDGHIIYQYTDKKLQYLKGMYVDAGDNIFVCDDFANKVRVITADGKKYGTLLTSSDGLKSPCSIAYREFDDTLLVGCAHQKNVFAFKLR